jgi:hypothetical protein
VPELDPYAALGVSRTATRDEIARAYRTAVKRAHPDTGARTSPAQMARLTAAWRILGDPARRARWDREHAPAVASPHWSGPERARQVVRPVVPQAPPSRFDSGWVVVGVVVVIAALVGGAMLLVLLVAEPPVRTSSYDGREIAFEYPDTWTLSVGEERGTHRVLAHLTTFSTGSNERCLTFAVPCQWEGDRLPAGSGSVQIIAWDTGPPPEPNPTGERLIGGRPSVHGQTTVSDEFLSAWWQLSPPGFPDRWMEVRAEIRGGTFERARRMAQMEQLLDSLSFGGS